MSIGHIQNFNTGDTMIINKLLKQKSITKYKLAVDSQIPHSTILDICNGKTSLTKCNSLTIYRLAKALDVKMEDLIEYEMRPPFEAYKSSVCHKVKNMGDLDFIVETLETNRIRELYDKHWYLESLYLLGMLDYLCRENNIPLCMNYNDIRRMRFSKPVYPAGVIALSSCFGNEHVKEDDVVYAIPEFKKFNIVENEVRNVI